MEKEKSWDIVIPETPPYEWTLVNQNLQEWRSVLLNPGISDKQKNELIEKLNRILDIMWKVHGRTKQSDEFISRMYYRCLKDIQDLKRRYVNWKKGRNRTDIKSFLACPMNHDIVIAIQNFPFDDMDIEEKATILLEGRPDGNARSLISEKLGISEERIQKKIKKMYNPYR